MLYRLIIKSNFYVAFTITCLSAFYQLMMSGAFDFDILLFTLITSWGFYTIARINFYEINKKKILMLDFFAICGLILFYKAFMINHKPIVLLILLGLFLIGWVYVFSFLKFNLRQIPFLKAFVIAFAISIFVVSVNFYQLDFKNHFNHFSLFPSCFFYLLGISILFDIKDIKYDFKSGLKTFPNTYGINLSKIIVLICFGFSFLFFYNSSYSDQSNFYYSFIISVFLSTCLSFLITEKTKPYFYTIFLETSLALPLIIYSFSLI